MEGYLNERGLAPGIGPEKGTRPKTGNGIARYKSPHGSSRYVAYVNGRAVSVLQVVSRDGKHAQVANVYTAPDHRREGWAATLLKRAEKDFRTVSHASEYNISTEGKAWIQGLKRKTSWKFSKPEDVE